MYTFICIAELYPFYTHAYFSTVLIRKAETNFPRLAGVSVSYSSSSSSFLGSTAQLRPWPPPQNPAEFLGGF
jgi:hypothetical protein